jgi:nitrous oxide reductase accessory protein NosL
MSSPPVRPHRRAVLTALAGFACVEATGTRAADAGRAAPLDLPRPAARDLCPVCGMFVAKYPLWLATLQWTDGTAVHFDGAKDLFKYLGDLPRWAPGRRREDVAQIGVTTYYEGDRVDALAATYVLGSDVYGPMGHEAVPHAARADAEEFLKDHGGRRIVAAADLTAALMRALDEGRFQ